MPVYLIADIKVHDKEMYQEYVSKAKPIVKKFGGQYVVQTDSAKNMSGDWTPERLIIIQFPSEEKMKECFGSEEYKKVAPLRTGSTSSQAIIAEGV